MNKPKISPAQLAKTLFAFLEWANYTDLDTLQNELHKLAKAKCPQGTIAKVAALNNIIETLNCAGVANCENEIEQALKAIEQSKKNSFNTWITSNEIDEQKDAIKMYKHLKSIHLKSRDNARKIWESIDSQVPIN